MNLFQNQTGDGTGTAIAVVHKSYAVQCSGDIGGGTLKLEYSIDGGTTWNECAIDAAQTPLAITLIAASVKVDLPEGLVRGVLTGSTTPDLTVNLAGLAT